MKQKFSRLGLVLYCVLFFAACLFFSLGLLLPGAADSTDGGARPTLTEDGRIRDDFGDAFERWFSKSFAFRGKTVDAFSTLKERALGTGNSQVVVGREDFLFFGETIDGYTGENRMTDDEIDAAAAALRTLQDYTEAHGAHFLFVAAPNKNTVYPEMMPDHIVRSDEATELDRLIEKLAENGTACLDLRGILAAEKETALLYHKRDTHWNAYGAGVAYRAIMDALGLPHTADPDEEGACRRDFRGDLDALLYPGTVRYDENIDYGRADRYVFTSAHASDMDMVITTRSAGENGRLLLFRDSFANALIDYAASDFSEVRFERAIPFRAELLETESFDYVIVEIAERNLRNLIGSAGQIGEDAGKGTTDA